MIGPGIAVTAAHCVSEFGSACYSGPASFVASQFSGTELYRTRVEIVYLPTVYLDGTDSCSVSGIVCENDVALLVLGTIDNPSGLSGLMPGNVGGYLNFSTGNDEYIDFGGVQSTQITALGYPGNLDAGSRMTRTDSIGYQNPGNQVEIGSSSRGGSSGGPWVANFGTQISSLYSSISNSKPNTIIATTSWGYVSDSLKVQGASRFGTNSAFTEKSNIQSLVDSYCCGLSYNDRIESCGHLSLQCSAPLSTTGLSFDYLAYANRYEDLKKAFGENGVLLTSHWRVSGLEEGRNGAPNNACGGFSPSIYGYINGLTGTASELTEHYKQQGVWQGQNYCMVQLVP